MIEFLEQYAPQIATFIGIVATVSPFLRQRIVQDKNIMKVFGNIKDMASKVGLKEIEITESLARVKQIADNLKDNIDHMEKKVNDKIAELDQTLINFQESDVFKKMLNGLNQLDQLKQMLENKDTTIQELGIVIKEIRKKLG